MNDLRDQLRRLTSLEGCPPGAFDAGSSPLDPTTLFREWFSSAVADGLPEPHAMTLSTVDADGSPDARVLILKDVTEGCWWFASSSESAKGRQLGASPAAALTFYWPAHARSVRIRGPVMAATATQSADDFGARGLGARAVTLASKESQPARNREEIDKAVAAARSRLAGDPSLTSATWSLWAVQADTVEFWQADRNRQHVRVRYSRDPNGWSRTLLWP